MFGSLCIGAALCALLMTAPQTVTETKIDAAVYEVRKQLHPFLEGGIYENMQIIYETHGEETRLTAADVTDWVRYWPDGHWDIDDDKMAEFLHGLQKKYDTWNEKKLLKKTGGGYLFVPAGNYGWKIDYRAEVQAMSRMLRTNGTTKHQIRFAKKAVKWGTPMTDYGDSYVEINLTDQVLWVYKEGRLMLRSDIVSGTMNTDRQTPAGAFSITYRQSPAVLRGADYESPVSYWMPFNGNIGMHDATWQSSFGGDTCYTNGSHGCINLPLKEAKMIFGMVRKDFPVLCYYEE